MIGYLLSLLVWFQGHLGLFDEKDKATLDEAITLLRRVDRPEETFMALGCLTRLNLNLAQYADTEKAAEDAFRVAQEGSSSWVMRGALVCRGMGLISTATSRMGE